MDENKFIKTSEIDKKEKINFFIKHNEISKENFEESNKEFTYNSIRESTKEKEYFTFKVKEQANKKNNFVKLQYNPQIITPKYFGNFGLFLETSTTITPDNIAEFAYPIVQFMQQTAPDYVIACDRGARLLGLAVHLLYQELYGELPTRNHSLMFRRISRSVPTSETAALLKPDIDKMTAQTASPSVLVLDDWVNSGQTKDITQTAFDKLSGGKAQVLYGVMRGPGADVTGKSDSAAMAEWHDNPNLIGVDYDYQDGTTPKKVNSKDAIEYRQRIAASIKEFAAGVKRGQTPTARRPLTEIKPAQMKDAA